MHFTDEELKKMPLSQIANLIRADWVKLDDHCGNYVDAMAQIETVKDRCGADDGETVVAYFLANAETWRGENARRIKAELKRRLEK